jgi:diaminopimelate decarboxylase
MKQGTARRFAIVDAAMNDLMRPSLYDAYHPIEPVRAPAADAVPAAVDVVGPICETADTLARQRLLPPLAADDLLVLRQAGAYGAVMASTYNSRPLVPEVLVNGDQFAVIRSRPDYDALLQRDRIPEWLNDQTTVRGAA